MKIKIKVTKEIIGRSYLCGTSGHFGLITENCAIALAVRDIFPNAKVGTADIKPFGRVLTDYAIPLPQIAKSFIHNFDILRTTRPQDRLNLPPIEFEIELPESVVEAINIEDIYKSETLELV